MRCTICSEKLLPANVHFLQLLLNRQNICRATRISWDKHACKDRANKTATKIFKYNSKPRTLCCPARSSSGVGGRQHHETYSHLTFLSVSFLGCLSTSLRSPAVLLLLLKSPCIVRFAGIFYSVYVSETHLSFGVLRRPVSFEVSVRIHVSWPIKKCRESQTNMFKTIIFL